MKSLQRWFVLSWLVVIGSCCFLILSLFCWKQTFGFGNVSLQHALHLNTSIELLGRGTQLRLSRGEGTPTRRTRNRGVVAECGREDLLLLLHLRMHSLSLSFLREFSCHSIYYMHFFSLSLSSFSCSHSRSSSLSSAHSFTRVPFFHRCGSCW